jgi:type III pantothenate kinase
VIGCGTCITFNFKDSREEFQGGSIHPGLKMRLQAMHTFTGKLPLVPLKKPEGWMAGSTENSLRVGAIYGAAREIDGMIAEYANNYEDLTVLLTGGDAEMLVSLLKNQIFALPDLTLVGLNKILESNV